MSRSGYRIRTILSIAYSGKRPTTAIQINVSGPLSGKGAYVDHLQPMVLVAMNTGLRFGELSRMRWTDLSLVDAPMITIQAAYAKTSKSRHIPLNATAKASLKAWKSQQEDTSGFVFANREGHRIKSVRNGWKAILSAAKIKDFKWHDLRHHFASKLVVAGVDLNTVRELLGHSSLDMTLRYAHLSPDMMANAVSNDVRESCKFSSIWCLYLSKPDQAPIRTAGVHPIQK